MPIYEYECAGCGHRLEAIQRHTEPHLKDCPECGKSRLKKLISAAGFRLSGKGWYETDFKDNKQKNLSRKDSAEDGAGSISNDTWSSEGKPSEGKSGETSAGVSKSDASKSDTSKSGEGAAGKKSKKGDSGTSKKSGDAKSRSGGGAARSAPSD